MAPIYGLVLLLKLPKEKTPTVYECKLHNLLYSYRKDTIKIYNTYFTILILYKILCNLAVYFNKWPTDMTVIYNKWPTEITCTYIFISDLLRLLHVYKRPEI